MKEKRFGYLDSLKGLATLSILMIHTGGSSLPGFAGRIGGDGARGVQLFFLISGMLTFMSLNKSIPNNQRISIKQTFIWYRSKLLRLIPLYYLALIICLLTKSWSIYWLGAETHVTAYNLITHFLLLHGLFPHYTNSLLGIEWYVGVLWIFLILSPLIYRLINSLEKSLIFAVAIYIINPSLNSFMASSFPVSSDPTIYDYFINEFSPLSQFQIFCWGAVAYYILVALNNTELNPHHQKLLSYSLLVLSVVLMIGRVNGEGYVFRLTANEVWGLIFFILLISQVLHSTSVIDNPIFRTIGKYSYGIYLYQFLWLKFYEKYINYQGFLDWSVKYIISLAALLCMSIALNHLIDLPLQKKISNSLT